MTDALIQQLSGPGGGFVLCLSIFYGMYLIMTKHFIPLAARHLDESDERFREMMINHIKDRDAYKVGLRKLGSRHDNIDGKLENIHVDVKGIRESIKRCNEETQ